MPQIVWTAGPDGVRDYFNHRWYEFFGSSGDSSKDQSWTDVVHPDDVQSGLAAWQVAVHSGAAYEVQSRLRDRDSGAYRWHLVRALAQRDDRGSIVKWVGTATDVDDHKRLTEELESRVEDRTRELSRSLVEKTTLLNEVHHRVKNNLQVIRSLLSLQIGSTKSDFQSVPLKDAYSRVVAMSLIRADLPGRKFGRSQFRRLHPTSLRPIV
jgi:PAS domain S-box-containing protein